MTGHSLPAKAACRDSMINMGSDESVLILIKHCQDMKQQETRLRLITFLLLLSCMALVLFMTSANLWQHKNTGSRQQENEVKQSPAYSRQGCPAENLSTDSKRLQIHLRSVPEARVSGALYMTWDAEFGQIYNQEKRAIVIPVKGFYFVYVRIALNCLVEDKQFKRFFVELQQWNKGYDRNVTLMDALDGIVCAPQGSKTVFLGRLFDLSEGDHLRVLIMEGYELITKSSFGAYLT
ncbi:uncharacterized protein LOC119030139 [Acanthopagrus latus]|uniref:uncharacterized protein LOC119030139 n=1 Tax=Acanthopagrus latus TaxID=8177 RepID=UPI00187BD399|nr:uncharacterized protein LOC119030139 [Acanthopagrus latus]